MARRDYYVDLGVAPNESPSGIRSAFRSLAKRYHPDRAGPESAGRFAEVREAYETLSDAVARRAYDEELRRRASPAEKPYSPWREAPEPLTADTFERSWEIGRSLDTILTPLLRHFPGFSVAGPECVEVLRCEIALSREEAASGGLLPIPIPICARCSRCAGSGRIWLFPCSACGETGWVEDRFTANLRIPPGLRSGTVLELPLDRLGLRSVILEASVRILPP